MLEVKNLSFAFKNRPLFQNISFETRAGQITRIEGPNGAGKSTLLSLVTGLLSGAQGSINFMGASDYRTWTSWIAPDANGLFPSLSAIENLQFWLQIRGRTTSHDQLRECLTFWGITGDWLQNALPTAKFSTGMKRRLSLARLQLESTKLWILDEPLFGLDDAACNQFKTMLSRHTTSGGAAIIVTHDARLFDGLQYQTVAVGGL